MIATNVKYFLDFKYLNLSLIFLFIIKFKQLGGLIGLNFKDIEEIWDI